jgi:hypothetical protein
MKALATIFITTLLATSLTGCLVRTRGHGNGHNHSARRGNDCGPAYHWNGRACVHNGRGHAKGHRK